MKQNKPELFTFPEVVGQLGNGITYDMVRHAVHYRRIVEPLSYGNGKVRLFTITEIDTLRKYFANRQKKTLWNYKRGEL